MTALCPRDKSPAPKLALPARLRGVAPASVLRLYPTSDSPPRAITLEPLPGALLPSSSFCTSHPLDITWPVPLPGSLPGTQAGPGLLCFPPQPEPSNGMVHFIGAQVSPSVILGEQVCDDPACPFLEPHHWLALCPQPNVPSSRILFLTPQARSGAPLGSRSPLVLPSWACWFRLLLSGCRLPQ